MIVGIIVLFLLGGLGVFLYRKYQVKGFARTHELSSDVYKTPILSTVSYILGAFLFGIGLLMLLGSLNNWGGQSRGVGGEIAIMGVLFCIGGLIQFGIGQVVEYLAKTSYCSFLIAKSIQPIDAKLIAIQKEIASLSAQNKDFSESGISIQNYYWIIDGKQYGPEKLNFVKNLFDGGIINLDSQIFREGENIWKTVKECPEIIS